MNTTSKFLFTLGGIALAAGLVGCAAAVSSDALPAPNATSTSTSSAPDATTPPERIDERAVPASAAPAQPKCSNPGRFSISQVEGGPVTSALEGTPRDYGPREAANGTVETDGAGTPVAYIVAPDDAASAIEARLCFDLIILHNGIDYAELQPGMRLSLLAEDFKAKN
ncbi:hypothetical protein [Microbacterium memoriense]|uniref:LysM domain-containing protein n=1 Tax=Microbacterium memoriense TaxID=2978350 RepID=A0ABT2P9N9_9MICO|nr:hypothetical protein [Microbacterium memoriense]MCT9000773.1 hypothetical protein [Microbacterium memoriense]